MPFADRLRELRLAAGLTQHELATRSGVQAGLVAKLEQAVVKQPRWDTVQALAAALGVPTDAFRDTLPEGEQEHNG